MDKIISFALYPLPWLGIKNTKINVYMLKIFTKLYDLHELFLKYAL